MENNSQQRSLKPVETKVAKPTLQRPFGEDKIAMRLLDHEMKDYL